MKQYKQIDPPMHTTVSGSADTPEALLSRVREARLELISLAGTGLTNTIQAPTGLLRFVEDIRP